MPIVYETLNGTQINFLKDNFLPPDDYGTADVELFPLNQHTMYDEEYLDTLEKMITT